MASCWLQYNTNNFLSQLSAPMGPYPFTISHDRVTDENATITVAPKHELLAAPNRLSDADLAGWVQERGLYFAGTWDAHHETPLSMNDPGESPKSGSVRSRGTARACSSTPAWLSSVSSLPEWWGLSACSETCSTMERDNSPPPILRSWRQLYAVVLLSLVAQLVLYTLLSRVYR